MVLSAANCIIGAVPCLLPWLQRTSEDINMQPCCCLRGCSVALRVLGSTPGVKLTHKIALCLGEGPALSSFPPQEREMSFPMAVLRKVLVLPFAKAVGSPR